MRCFSHCQDISQRPLDPEFLVEAGEKAATREEIVQLKLIFVIDSVIILRKELFETSIGTLV